MKISLHGLTQSQQVQKLEMHIAKLQSDLTAKQVELSDLHRDIKSLVNIKRGIECGGLYGVK